MCVCGCIWKPYSRILRPTVERKLWHRFPEIVPAKIVSFRLRTATHLRPTWNANINWRMETERVSYHDHRLYTLCIQTFSLTTIDIAQNHFEERKKRINETIHSHYDAFVAVVSCERCFFAAHTFSSLFGVKSRSRFHFTKYQLRS